MSLIGYRKISLDAKGRAVMPASFRAVLPQKLLICAAFQEKAALIFTEESFDKYSAEARKHWNEDYFAVWNRVTYASMNILHIDEMGRFLLPKTLAEHVTFEREIHLYGMGIFISLFPKEREIEDNPECVLV